VFSTIVVCQALSPRKGILCVVLLQTCRLLLEGGLGLSVWCRSGAYLHCWAIKISSQQAALLGSLGQWVDVARGHEADRERMNYLNFIRC